MTTSGFCAPLRAKSNVSNITGATLTEIRGRLHGSEVALLELLGEGVQRARGGLQVAVHTVVSKIILGARDVDGNKGAHPAGHHPVLMEYDAGGDHQPGVREESSVVNRKKFTLALVRHAHIVLVPSEALATLLAVVRAVRVAAIARLRAIVQDASYQCCAVCSVQCTDPVTGHAAVASLRVDAELVLVARAPGGALVHVLEYNSSAVISRNFSNTDHAAVLRVHGVASLALGAGLGSRAGAVAGAGLVARLEWYSQYKTAPTRLCITEQRSLVSSLKLW